MKSKLLDDGKSNAVYSFKFVVEGRNNFPLDMLRYDACWPASASDVNRLARSLEFNTELKRIELYHVHPARMWDPSTKRWASFDWRVLDVSEWGK